jgi:salicylate hydroxylase
VGDAAHATLPYLAQGAAMSLEDACVLAKLIQNSTVLENTFKEFSNQRFARTEAIQRRSRQLGNIYHAAGLLKIARNALLMATPAARSTRHLSWIYDWNI